MQNKTIARNKILVISTPQCLLGEATYKRFI